MSEHWNFVERNETLSSDTYIWRSDDDREWGCDVSDFWPQPLSDHLRADELRRRMRKT